MSSSFTTSSSSSLSTTSTTAPDPTVYGPGEGPLPSDYSSTSFTTPTTHSQSSQSPNSDTGGRPNGGNGYTASLYLFVFLATLLLLLSLSVAVLLRSFILRRRFRRRVEEALAAGLLAPLGGPGSGAAGLSRNLVRPVLHEVALEPHDEKAALLAGWSDIQPLTAEVLRPGAREPPTPPLTAAASSGSLARLFGESRFPRSAAARAFDAAAAADADAQSLDDHASSSVPTKPGAEPYLQLAVLLAMPGAPGELALGVAQHAVPESLDDSNSSTGTSTS